MRYVFCIMSGNRLSSQGFDSLEKAQEECIRKGYTFKISDFCFSAGNNLEELRIYQIKIS